MKSPLTANVLQVLEQYVPADALAALERACTERGWRACDLTSSQLEALIPALCAFIGAPSDAEARSDLRLLLDTDRFRRERLAAKPEKPVVLVVEDDEDTRATFADVLSEAGYATVTAAGGDEAWSVLESGTRPATIVLDLMMPTMSGWQLLDLMQGVSTFAGIPVVVVTASGLGPGAFGSTIVLRKPVSRTQLLGAVSVSVLRDGPHLP